jgi:hypothetical protein
MARDDKADETKKSVSAFQLWFEEAWEGWLKPIGTILLIALAYALYKFDLVSESLAGVVVVLVVILGALGSAVLPAWPLAQKPRQRAMLATLVGAWLAATGIPSLRAAMPPAPLGSVQLTSAQPSAKLHVDGNGPFEAEVSGRFKQAGSAEAEASYIIKVEGGGASDEISGSLKRSMVRLRTSRRGGTSAQLQEHLEVKSRVPHAVGPDLTFTADGVDEGLDGGLTVTMRRAGLSPSVFVVLALVALGLALSLDARLTDLKGKAKTYLTAALGVCLVFAYQFPEEATAHSAVRPAVGALFLGVLTGGLGGWLLGTLARLFFGPKIKKAKR